jgi:hypothetical protein
MWKHLSIGFGLFLVLLWSNGRNTARHPASAGFQDQISYTIQPVSRAPALRSVYTDDQIALLEKLNRADASHLKRLRFIVLPSRFDLDEVAYSPLPVRYEQVADTAKLLVIHLPAQVFGAYEHGALIRWGPISSGSSSAPTPAGLFHLNWKARSCCSTVNPEWVMTWYFNFENRAGLAIHAYTLPGFPASHGCIRLLERDALWVYQWGDTWQLTPDEGTLTKPGTPVEIVGHYNFKRRRPWLEAAFYEKKIALPADK